MHQIVGRLPEALGYYKRSKRHGVDRAVVHIKDVSSPSNAPQASLLLCDTPASLWLHLLGFRKDGRTV